MQWCVTNGLNILVKDNAFKIYLNSLIIVSIHNLSTMSLILKVYTSYRVADSVISKRRGTLQKLGGHSGIAK
jgi:hypothetical protein